ncbi:unnamed protein product [Peronospora belbahrii]|uniref:1,3-beta-glucan synthase n=1 Tax=Peronospora belbahrii TaxID=622444 RepID=A0AAU9KWG0_9STRA|nr:unnamed protein product [Peronospora belbahrii]
MVNADPQGQTLESEGWYLNHVIRPIWNEASNMTRRNALGKPLEHVKIRNYDDLNEYFWKPHCLSIPVTRVGQELTQHHGKTFYEHRSLFTLILNYYRIFQFNLMYFVLLIVLAFAVTISPSGGTSGWHQFESLGTVVTPYTTRDLKLAIVAIPFSLSLLAFLKCVLEVSHGWHLLTSREQIATSSRSFTYGAALTSRIVWNGGFAILFGAMIYVPLYQDKDTILLDNLYPLCGGYILPGTLILLIQAFAPQVIHGSFASKFVREGESCYVGQDMAPPLLYQLKYIVFWIFLWIIQGVTSYFILVRPLMLPTLSIYAMRLDYQNPLALLGGFQGVLMKTGEIRGAKEMTKAFRVAPQLFDQKVVTLLARSSDAPTSGNNSTRASALAAAYESQMMLRFVVVWNEIVNSFRAGDLLDDKEAAILQYDIRSTGEVFEPVFLSAGKLAEAMSLAIKTAKDGKGESQLRVTLVENDCLSAIRSFFTASMYVTSALFGNDDADVVDGFRMIEEIASSGGFLKSFNVRELASLCIAAVDLLEEILDLPDPGAQPQHIPNARVHPLGVIRNFVSKMKAFLNGVQSFCLDPALQRKFGNSKFCSSDNGYMYASRGLVNLFCSDTAMDLHPSKKPVSIIAQIVYNMNTTEIIMSNSEAYGFDDRVYKDMDSVYNTQYYIQAGLFLSLPLICVYFAEMGLRRGLVQFLEMVFTAGPMFFIFQLGTTMHFFDNNLLHGEAQYKATGRGFKITRETFVLLYKAYALSHYRKAIELIGLCLVYLAFGKFDICDISVAGQTN